MTTIDKRMIYKNIKQKTPEEQEAIASGLLTPILINELKKRLASCEAVLDKVSEGTIDKLYEP